MQDTVDYRPPGQGDVGQIHLQRDTARPLGLLPAVQDLGVSLHRPHRVGSAVIQLVPQISRRYFHGCLEPLVQIVSLRGMPGPWLAPHPSLQPAV